MTKFLYLLLFLSFPIIDLLVASNFTRGGEGQACTGVFCPGVWIVYANVLVSWAALYAVVYWLSILGRNSGIRIVKIPAYLGVFVFFSMLTVYCLFSWSFIVVNGFPPSPDALQFLVLNAVRVPAHTLQTSPVLSVIFVVVVLAVAFGMTWLMTQVTGRINWGMKPRAAVTASAFLLVALSSTYAGANVSTIAINKLVVKRLGAFANTLSADQAMAEDFVPASPYVASADAVKGGPVIVILVESLRRDLIEAAPNPIPFLKNLAQGEGVFFDRAYATASHSNYADVAFWYSRYPMRSLDLQRYESGAPERGLSLFSAFRQHGYTTAYISSQNEHWGGMINWLDGEVDHFYHSEDYEGETWFNEDDKKGIAKLIKKGVATAGKIEDSETLRIARRWIDGLDGRRDFLLTMNLQNTHFSYVIPPGGAEPFKPDDMDFATVYYRWPEERKEAVRNRYLNAVVNLDRLLGEFAAYLKQKGLWDDAVFVVVGDSGEAFYEHGFGNHSGPMYDEAMRTFSVIKPPQSSRVARGRFDRAISHLDIAPSVLSLLGMPAPGSFQGHSVFESGVSRPPVFMHTNAIVKQNGIVDWPWKFLHTYYPHERTELYNLENDPGEQRNLGTKQADVSDRLSRTLDLWVRRQLLYYSDETYYSRFEPPQ